jgi:hypothetical protein
MGSKADAETVLTAIAKIAKNASEVSKLDAPEW